MKDKSMLALMVFVLVCVAFLGGFIGGQENKKPKLIKKCVTVIEYDKEGEIIFVPRCKMVKQN